MESIKFRAVWLRYCNSCLGEHLPVKDYCKICGAISKPAIENGCKARGAGMLFQ